MQGKIIYRYKSHYWKWKLSLWQFLPFYDPRMKAAQELIAADEEKEAAAAAAAAEAAAAEAAEAGALLKDSRSGGGGGRGSFRGKGAHSPTGGGSFRAKGAQSPTSGRSSPTSAAGGTLSGRASPTLPAPEDMDIKAPDWCHIEDTGTELRLLSDEERWEDAVRTIPWKPDTLYNLTIRNLATKAVGMSLPGVKLVNHTGCHQPYWLSSTILAVINHTGCHQPYWLSSTSVLTAK
jgi:hypothetical protein